MIGPMLFLMNDVVFNLDAELMKPPVPLQRLHMLTFDFVKTMGAELYAEQPLLHLSSPERAKRLASLIINKAPQINGALFIAPDVGCAPEKVFTRFVEIGIDVMALLYSRQQDGRLDRFVADQQVWRRLAA